MTINKPKLAALAADCHTKQATMQTLHQRMQKSGTPEIAGQYAIAKVEYNRAKNLLDLEIREQSVTFVPEVIHASDCALHDGPALRPASCDCGADPRMTPEKYGTEQPPRDRDAV